VLKLIVRANARHDKAPLLLEVREEVEQLKVILRPGDWKRADGRGGARAARASDGWWQGASARRGFRMLDHGATPGSPLLQVFPGSLEQLLVLHIPDRLVR